MTNNIHPELAAIRKSEKAIGEQLAAKQARIAVLREKLNDVNKKIEACASAACGAQAALQEAFASDDHESVTNARQQAEQAISGQSIATGALALEAQAIQGLIDAETVELNVLVQESVALAPKVHALMRQVLDAEGATLSSELEAAARALMSVYAKAHALSDIAQTVGAPGVLYGPNVYVQEPLRLLNVGAERWLPKSKTYVVVTANDQVEAASNAAWAALREQGF